MRKAAIVLVAIVLLSLAPAISMPTSATTTPPSLDELRQAATDAYNYLVALKRSIGGYAFIAEYPSVVVTVVGYTPYGGQYVKLYFIPGTAYFDDDTDLKSDTILRDVSVSNAYYGTYYTWYMDLIVGYPGSDGVTYVDVVMATLKVVEYRGYPYSYVKISVEKCDPSLEGSIYLFGDYVGEVSDNTVGNSYIKQISDTPLPAMRTSVRHVDEITSLLFKNLKGVYAHQDLYMFAGTMMGLFFSSWSEYDIYNPIYTGFVYHGRVEAPNEMHFYDAHWFGNRLGYYDIWDFFSNHGWIYTTYPAYPYKSKVVSAAEVTFQNGGTLFLIGQQVKNDPLYYTWWGLYYAYIGNWAGALQIWNEKVLPAWDGTGVYFSDQVGYSTVRLATALVLGALLADHGYISWDVPDEMINVLLQLQWHGSGYYSLDDGTTKIWIVKPDHKGGFMVSYDHIGSYGFVPFRPKLIEEMLDLTGLTMDPEYIGPIPTNAETTALALAAIAQYAYLRYGWPPGQLLLS